MVLIMRVFKKLQKGPMLKLILMLEELPSSSIGAQFEEQVSEIFNINDLVEVRFQYKSQCNKTFYSFSYRKHEMVADKSIKLNISCKNVLFSQELNCPEHFTEWIKMSEIRQESTYSARSSNSVQYNFWHFNRLEVTLTVFKVQTVTFAKLYEDEEFCDFHLMTTDSAAGVPIHRACLALHSDMFRTMLQGQWRENANGCIRIEGVTLESLRHLKQYFYLGTLPNDIMSLQPLLLVAKCYMIDSLAAECTMKLAEIVKPEEMFSLQEFAVEHRMTELLKAILQYTPARTFQRAHLLALDGEDAGPSDKSKNL